MLKGAKDGVLNLDIRESSFLMPPTFRPVIQLICVITSYSIHYTKLYDDALAQFGAECSTNEGFLPIKVKGPIKGGQISVDGSLSSQVLTGLLMASPMASFDVTILVNNLKSIPYVQLTVDMRNNFV